MNNDGTWNSTRALPAIDPAWSLIEEGFNLAREHEIESLFSVSNGYVGTRGSLAEGCRLSAPATFIAGVFDVDEHTEATPRLAEGPDWTALRVSIDGNHIRLEQGETLQHRRVLDLRHGVLWREWRHRDPAGRISLIRGLRFASLADRHVLAQLIALTPENYSGRIDIQIPAPASVQQLGQRKLMPPTGEAGIDLAGWLDVRTYGGGVSVAFAAALQVRNEKDELIKPRVRGTYGLELDVEMGRMYRFDRLVVAHTLRDSPQPAEAAARHLQELLANGIAALIDAHSKKWEARWQVADVEVEGDLAAQRALRFACYHLISVANPEDERVSIGARALTGEAYKGHVFWDTEIYILPFYIVTDPPAARAPLMYRYHTLPAARERARRWGYRGALYAWESAATGAEVTPRYVLAPDGEVIRILSGEQEHHISADIAYAVWQYWQVRGDDDFFVRAGAEIMLETARFWASRGEFGEDGRYHIRRVMGPDEYHETVDDNAYTNGMAQWNLERGVETAQALAQRWPEDWSRLASRLAVNEPEVNTWRELARRMHTGLDPRTGLIEQFQGYFLLEEIDLAKYAQRRSTMEMLLGREPIRRSKIIKQADVVLLIYLLWERFPPAVREANFRYYEARTAHDSSLSPAVYALVAARLGDTRTATRYFRQTAEIDLANNMGNAAGGVHVAALGGLWQATVFGFAGMRFCTDGLALVPHLPPPWLVLRFTVQWRGRYLKVTIKPGIVEVVSQAGNIRVSVGDTPPVEIVPGKLRRWQQSPQESWSQVSL